MPTAVAKKPSEKPLPRVIALRPEDRVRVAKIRKNNYMTYTALIGCLLDVWESLSDEHKKRALSREFKPATGRRSQPTPEPVAAGTGASA